MCRFAEYRAAPVLKGLLEVRALGTHHRFNAHRQSSRVSPWVVWCSSNRLIELRIEGCPVGLADGSPRRKGEVGEVSGHRAVHLGARVRAAGMAVAVECEEASPGQLSGHGHRPRVRGVGIVGVPPPSAGPLAPFGGSRRVRPWLWAWGRPVGASRPWSRGPVRVGAPRAGAVPGRWSWPSQLGERAPRGIRTPNLRIKSPLLCR